MNIIRKFMPLRSIFTKIVETVGSVRYSTESGESAKRLVIEPLADRELVRVQGEEVVPFLQGLITNDISHLQNGQFNVTGPAAMYTLFLNKAGRILYDSIIYRTAEPTSYLIECDKHISTELRRHLRLYRVRREIKIDSVDNEYRPWILFNPDHGGEVCFDITRLNAEYFYTPDPRVRDLGLRVLTKADKTWTDLAKIFSTPGEVVVSPPTKDTNYRLHRYRFGIGEGVDDIPPGKCFPLETNADFLHGVSFHKGCYIGQELTARVYHTGTVRKRLMPLSLSKPLAAKDAVVKNEQGTTVGVIRGVVSDCALALLRVEHVLGGAQLTTDNEPCYAKKPKWWPTELPKRLKERGFS